MTEDCGLERLRPGRYALPLTHTAKPSCGGPIHVERVGWGRWRWEVFCARCRQCDPNGWPTLTQALAQAPGYFGEEEERHA